VEYNDQIRQVATAHVDEIQGDLDRARHELAQRRGDVGQLERHIASLERLVEIAQPGPVEGQSADDPMTLHVAMELVLRDARHGMRAGELANEITRRRLYRMRDGRPVETQQIHARVGNYGHRFKKVGTLIQLADSERP
jgi:hypothetical protein